MIPRRLLALVIAAGCLLGLLGCGGDRGKGTNAHKDRPTPATQK
jgi:hypothetical protein